MPDEATEPLLSGESVEESRSERPGSQRSKASTRSKRSEESRDSDESTPLLSRDAGERDYGDAPPVPGETNGEATSPAASSLRSLQYGRSSKKNSTRWPTIIALTILGLVIIVILCFGFAAPAVMEEYAKESMVFEPTNLSIDSFTPTGVRARIQGDFTLDGSRVHKKPVRDLGRAGTWIARKVESKKSKVQVYLPEYDDILLGTAVVPPIVVDIRDGHTTHIDFLSDLSAGDLDGIRRMAMDWIDGRIGQISVRGVADVPLKSGIFGLGTQSLAQTIVFNGQSYYDLSDHSSSGEFQTDKLMFFQGMRYQRCLNSISRSSISMKLNYPTMKGAWPQTSR